MRRLALGVSFGVLMTLGAPGIAWAQEGEPKYEAEAGGASEVYWKLGNFVLLAAVLGYLIAKKAPPYFAARSAGIKRGLEEAAKMRERAEERYQEIEQRLARLDGEIAEMRRKAAEESGAETERVRVETELDLEKIRAATNQEMAAALRAARLDLRAYSAELAVGLAAQKIRRRLTPEADSELVDTMVNNIERHQTVRAS